MNLHEGKRIILGLKRAFDELGMPFWLIYGTCLGVVRDGTLIEYDKDIDIGFHVNDMHPMFNEVMLKHVGVVKGHFLQHDPAHRMWLARIGDPQGPFNERLDPYVDITPFYDIKGKWWFLRGDVEERGKLIGKDFPYKYFDTFTSIELFGECFRIPCYPEDYLTYLYGDSWRVPQPKVSGLNPFKEIYE